MTDPAGAGIYAIAWLGYIDGIHVTIYSSTMDPMGLWMNSQRIFHCQLWTRGQVSGEQSYIGLTQEQQDQQVSVGISIPYLDRWWGAKELPGVSQPDVIFWVKKT